MIHGSLSLPLVRCAEYNCPMEDGIEAWRLRMLLDIRHLRGGVGRGLPFSSTD